MADLPEKDREFLVFLADQGYHGIVPIGNDRWAAVWPLAFTDAILVGRMGDYNGHDLRFCYARGKADAALAEWASRDFAGEPQGWHRDPYTGRRRDNGDPDKEEIRW